jgi:hypothetical protein
MPTRGQGDLHSNTDEELIRHAFVDIEAFSALPTDAMDELVREILRALGYYRTGLQARTRGVSNNDISREVFARDIFKAVKLAGFRATRWRKKYDGGEDEDESLSFRVIRALFDQFKIRCPKDLKRIGQRAAALHPL